MLFLFKQKTAYEMRISDWSSDVCSSDLHDRIYFLRSVQKVAYRVDDRHFDPGRVRRLAQHGGGERAFRHGLAVSHQHGGALAPAKAKAQADIARGLRGADRKRVGAGKSVSVRVGLGGRGTIKKKNQTQ